MKPKTYAKEKESDNHMSDIVATKQQSILQQPNSRNQPNRRGAESNLDKLVANGKAGMAILHALSLQHPAMLCNTVCNTGLNAEKT